MSRDGLSSHLELGIGMIRENLGHQTIQIQYCSTALLHLEELLEATNVNLKIRHIRLLIEYRYDQLCLGGTWTESLGTQKRRR